MAAFSSWRRCLGCFPSWKSSSLTAAIKDRNSPTRWQKFFRISTLKSSGDPTPQSASRSYLNAGSSNAPSLGSIAAGGSPKIGRTSIARRLHSCASLQFASCSENSVIRPKVSGQTLKEEALKSLLHNWIDEPDFTVEHLEWPAAQTNFYIGAFTARPFALAVGHPPDYLVRQQREWIAKSLVYAMAKMIDRYYLQSDLACGRELHSITLYALGYRATGERWLKLAGFDLEIPRDHRTIRYLVVRHSRFLLLLIGLKNVFTDFVGTKYPVYKLVADRRKVRQFLRKHAGYAEGVNIKLT